MAKVIGWDEYQAKKAIEKASKGIEKPLSTDNDFYVAKATTPKFYDVADVNSPSKRDSQSGSSMAAKVTNSVRNSYGSYGGSFDNYDSAYSKSYSKTPVITTRCFHSHKPLKIVVKDKEYLIYGGSCSEPVVKDADIYVGFELGMKSSPKAYPWSGGASFTFHIQDGSVPTSVEDTKHLLKYLSDNLIEGKKIHIGCIGGHGRTGTILAALVTYMTGNKDSIEYVRTNYCEKAVESITQVNWLNKHFGIEKAKPSKDYMGLGASNTFGSLSKTKGVSKGGKTYSEMNVSKEVASAGYTLFETVKPVKVKGSIWGF